MLPSEEIPTSSLLDIESLEWNPAPIFIIRFAVKAQAFNILYSNEAFRKAGFQDLIQTHEREALIFRSWTQAVSGAKTQHDFSGTTWSAEIAGSNGRFKVIRALVPDGESSQRENGTDNQVPSQSPVQLTGKEDSLQEHKGNTRTLLQTLPRANFDARGDMIQTMMEMSDVGVFEYNAEGKLLHANEAWYRLSSHPRNLPAHVEFSFMDLVYPDDQALVISMWNTLSQGNPVTFEMRWKARSPNDVAQWVLSACVPIFDGDTLTSIAGNTIDINAQKKIQDVQRRRIEGALEAKRQQENFIDMTSHELRNPLSAVVQCADSVITTLQGQFNPAHDALISMTDAPKLREEIDASIDALQTIISCSLHQKRIIDDVLTLSKLDSNLILITPIRVQPPVVVSDTMRMFEAECAQMDIQLKLVEDDSLKEINWVMLDPSRLVQILINLLTNAIKFTKDRPKRIIEVKLGGSTERPPRLGEHVVFPKTDDPDFKIVERTEWGNGKKAFVWVTVSDTGRGMTDEEQEKLFFRFSQATPRTHIKYGGSGLGLFISRSLATLQGGQIGVFSQPDVGSTFAFYVSTRLAEPPKHLTSNRPTPLRTTSTEDRMKNVKLNVLIVEDNLVNQKVLKKQLQKFGWNVSVAGDGEQALEWLRNSVYWQDRPASASLATSEASCYVTNTVTRHELDIILLDIEMPVMDGLTCARVIREYERQGLLGQPRDSPSPTQTGLVGSEERASRLPILAVSANARLEQIELALAAGMDDAIAKPFRIPELWPKIQGLLPHLTSLR